MIGQLVTIRFEGEKPDENVTVYWYHVPRRGDWIEVIENGAAISGEVEQVYWGSEQVIVSVK